MPLHLICGDITRIQCDAIVNAANASLLGGGGVDGAIHRAAGPELLAECRTLGGCKTGEAKVTKGYRLPARWVIHTVGPVWRGGNAGEPDQLRACYRNSLLAAAALGAESVAFPLISAGVYGYPLREAQETAVQTIADFLQTHDMTVTLVIFGGTGSRPEWYPEIAALFCEPEACYAAAAEESDEAAPCREEAPPAKLRKTGFFGRQESARRIFGNAPVCSDAAAGSAPVPLSLREALDQPDESFSQMLLRLIDRRGMSDAECYKKANIDRKLFSKIRGDVHYQTKKVTVLAFAIALELTLPETEMLLRSAGYAFSHANRFDIIVEYFIRKGRYDVYAINEVLFAFDQLLIGA